MHFPYLSQDKERKKQPTSIGNQAPSQERTASNFCLVAYLASLSNAHLQHLVLPQKGTTAALKTGQSQWKGYKQAHRDERNRVYVALPNTSSKAKVSHIISVLCPFLRPCVFQKTRRRRTIRRDVRTNFWPKIACLEARLLTLYVTSFGRPSHSETWGTPTIWFVLQLTKLGTASKLQAKMIRYLVRQHQFKGQRQLKRKPHFGT